MDHAEKLCDLCGLKNMIEKPTINQTPIKINRALISVFDKTGVVELAQSLHQHGVEILSTGGTAKALRYVDIPVTDVSDYTKFPEIMDGRVKTINPLVEGGILGLRDAHSEDVSGRLRLGIGIRECGYRRTHYDPLCCKECGVGLCGG